MLVRQVAHEKKVVFNQLCARRQIKINKKNKKAMLSRVCYYCKWHEQWHMCGRVNK
jgi:hypothetical protein